MSLPYHPRHSHKENARPPDYTMRFTPNFKIINQSTAEYNHSTYDFDSTHDIQVPHKSFDLSLALANKAFLQPAQRKPLTTKRNLSNETFRLAPHFHEGHHIPLESFRKPVKAMKANVLFSGVDLPKSSKRETIDVPTLMPKRSSSSRDKLFGVNPVAEISRKGKELRNSTFSSREKTSEKKKHTENRDSPYESNLMDSHSSEVESRYKICIKAYEDLMGRNKQVEESLRFEVLRGEEQRAYIEVLKETISDNETKLKDRVYTMIKGQTHRDDENRSERMTWKESRANVYTEISNLNADMQATGALEGRVSKHIEIFQDKLNEVTAEKENVKEQLGQYHEANEELMEEVDKLREVLRASQGECMKMREGNNVLVEQIERYRMRHIPQEEHQKLMKDHDNAKRELNDVRGNYEDLKVLSTEIENQRKMTCKKLEEEANLSKKLEIEKEGISRKLKEIEREAKERERHRIELETKLTEEKKLVKEVQQKFETLEENYGVLTMTLNETEGELERMREVLKKKEETERDEKSEMDKLKEDYMQLEENIGVIQQEMVEGKENMQRELDIKEKDLDRVYKELDEISTLNEKLVHENEVLQTEKGSLIERIETLMYSSRESKVDVEELSRRYDGRERAIKVLKEQVSVLEKENGLLKALSEGSKHKNVTVERLKEDNTRIEKKNNALNRRIDELKNNIEAINTEYREAVQRTSEVSGTLDRLERELQEIIENYLPQDDLFANTEELSEIGEEREPRDDTERKCRRIVQLVGVVKKNAERLNERYTQAKVDAVKEMEKCEEMENNVGKLSVIKRENSMLKERIEGFVGKLREVDNEKEALKKRNEELYQRFSQVSMHVQLLKEEVGEARSKEKTNTQGLKGDDDKSLLKDAMIRRLNKFIFNTDARELIEELMRIEAKMLAEERGREKIHPRNSLTSVSTDDHTEKKEASFVEFQATHSVRNDHEGTAELDRAKRGELEKELAELETQERQRYDTLYSLQKQNFELKNEISRLMNELEVNYSEYGNTKIDCYTHKMNDRLNFTNGFDLTMTEMDTKAHKEVSASDFHMEYSMEKITGENEEDPYYS